MNIGMNIHGGMSHERVAALLKKNNVTHSFIMSDTKDFDSAVKHYIDNGITLDTLHAPFSGINAMWGEDEDAGSAMLAKLLDSVDKCAKYGIPTTIIHVSSGRPMPEISEAGIRRYTELFEYAKKNGVKVALENLRYIENLRYFFDRYDSPVFCWDTGHENCYTDGIKHMELFGNRLGALHIHDNRCVWDSDDHMLPFDGAIDFEEVAQYIAKSGYEGTVMLEICRSSSVDGKNIYEDLTDEEYVERAVSAARKIADRIEEIRKEIK